MDLEDFHCNNGQDFIIKSDIPSEIGKHKVIIGIDEAGRGPVLGPMVYGACYVAEKDEPLLTSLKVADSKTLTEEQRDACFSNLQTGRTGGATPGGTGGTTPGGTGGAPFGWIAQILPPASISRNQLSRCKYNLNAISHDSAMFLIQSIVEMGVAVAAVFVDTVGDVGKYQTKLQERFPFIPNITVAKKADSLYPVVSAASIVAKVCRDQALREWRFLEGSRFQKKTNQINVQKNEKDVQKNEKNDKKNKEKLEEIEENIQHDVQYGSGYPGDPATKKFLLDYCDDVFGFPQLVRFSWSTTVVALEKAVVVKWEKVILEEEMEGSQPITNFFKKRPREGQEEDASGMVKRDATRHRFFAERNLLCVESL